jgi:hypothetical protein
VDARELSEAIVVWTGYRETTSPARDEQRLVGRLGETMCLRLLPRIRALADEFYASDARFVVEDLEEMGRLAASQFRHAHPELTDEGVNAFAWCYTFDYK